MLASVEGDARAVLRTLAPFVFVTGYADRTVHESALRAAPRLEKPVKAKELVRLVEALARSR